MIRLLSIVVCRNAVETSDVCILHVILSHIIHLFFTEGELHFDVNEGDDISLQNFPQYPAHLQRFDSNTSLNAITRQSMYISTVVDLIIITRRTF